VSIAEAGTLLLKSRWVSLTSFDHSIGAAAYTKAAASNNISKRTAGVMAANSAS